MTFQCLFSVLLPHPPLNMINVLTFLLLGLFGRLHCIWTSSPQCYFYLISVDIEFRSQLTLLNLEPEVYIG